MGDRDGPEHALESEGRNTQDTIRSFVASFDSIILSFGEVSSVNSRIACSLQEQSGAVKDIAGRIYAINDDAEDLSKKSASVIQAVDEIDKNAEMLKERISHFIFR